MHSASYVSAVVYSHVYLILCFHIRIALTQSITPTVSPHVRLLARAHNHPHSSRTKLPIDDRNQFRTPS
jgi:hypothetical protein